MFKVKNGRLVANPKNIATALIEQGLTSKAQVLEVLAANKAEGFFPSIWIAFCQQQNTRFEAMAKAGQRGETRWTGRVALGGRNKGQAVLTESTAYTTKADKALWMSAAIAAKAKFTASENFIAAQIAALK